MSRFNIDHLDLDSVLGAPVESKTLTRWERKAKHARTPSASSSKTPALAATAAKNKCKTPRNLSQSAINSAADELTAEFTAEFKATVANANGSSAKTPKASKTPGKISRQPSFCADRFIPHRNGEQALALSAHKVRRSSENSALDAAEAKHAGDHTLPPPDTPTRSAHVHAEFKSRLAETLFHGEDVNTKILAFKSKAPRPADSHQNNMRVLYTQNRSAAQKKSMRAAAREVMRRISTTPERILDAPDILDDYYLNLLDWGSRNMLAVALCNAIYIWNAVTGETELLCELEDQEDEDIHVTSVKWMGDGAHLAVGTSTNDVQLWNVERKKKMRSMKGHLARVGSLAWNNHVLSSGSRDTMIFNHDVRVAQHHIGTLRGHEQEICGLAWSPDGTQLASGGNDNVCCIWDVNSSSAASASAAAAVSGDSAHNQAPRFSFTESCAAVKALAWCPFQKNVLATGSGTADRHIRFYNTQRGTVVNQIDTQSQVCSLVWSPYCKELISGHGFSQNQLCVWKYPTMAKVAELTGHTSRVLHMSLSSDGTTVCSAAADETLRFWKVWDPPSLGSDGHGKGGKKRGRGGGLGDGKDSSSRRMRMKIR